MTHLADQEFTDPYLNRPVPFEIRVDCPHVEDPHLIKIAFWNVLTTYVWNKPNFPREKYPQYDWALRCRPMIDLISQDHPTVLGLCELDLTQVKSLEEEMVKGGKLEGYKLVGFSSEMGTTIEKTKKRCKDTQWKKYGEFVALLIDTKRIHIEDLQCISLPKIEPQKWRRILVQAKLYDTATKVHFAVLASHFDHQSEPSRQQSAHLELGLIEKLEKEHIPWFSISDRNWGRDEAGANGAKQYASHSAVADFRDDTRLGCFGQPGTFFGDKTRLKKISNAVIIRSKTVDTGYRSKALVEAEFYYTLTGEYNIKTGQLGPSKKKHCVSDHFYIGQACHFKKR